MAEKMPKTHHFTYFFQKKTTFFLHNTKKSRTFAPANEK